MQIDIGEKQFFISKLNVFEQFHVARKLLPIISGFLKEADLGNIGELSENMSMEKFVKNILPPLADYIASIDEAEANSIIYPCLSVTKIKTSHGVTSPIFDKKEKVLMFDDITLVEMMKIVIHVVKDSLGNFLQELQENAPSVQP